MMGLLDGKVAIVTGAAHGIGRAHALLFAREGARVVVNDLGGSRNGNGSDPAAAKRVVEEIVAAGGRAVASAESVATAEGARSIVRTAVDAFGRVDVLVNNAGIMTRKTFLEIDDAMWQSLIAVHLSGTFHCSHVFAEQVIAQGGGGRIVNTTSVAGMLGNFGDAGYAAAKAGIYGLTRKLANELMPHEITVNAIAPVAKTRMTEDLPLFEDVDVLTPEHTAPAALFLASDLCRNRTGHVLAVAGPRMYAFKVVESIGKLKESDDGVWTAGEIAEAWDAIIKT
jgi:NAD(P)-dependent dehydrogenase (short-subunit alcohol dehydrogenase family)